MRTRTIYREVERITSKQRRRSSSAAERDLVAQATDVTSVLGNFGGVSGFQGANWNTTRGYVYWPTLDPKREYDAWSRVEIARKTHWLCGNIGFPRRIIEGLTNLIVGTGLNVHVNTGDTKWNALSQARYRARSRSPIAYSVNGELGGVGMQRLAVKTDLKDGDAAIVFAKSQAGGPLRTLYSGLQISNAIGQPDLDQSKWKDGIFYDSLERAAFYRFPDYIGGTYTDIPAQNVRFLKRMESPGQRRGMGIMTHCVNKMIDREEIGTALTQGIKQSSQIGYYMTSDSDEKRRGAAAAARGRNTRTINTPSGKVTVKLVYGSGGEIVSLPKGCDIKTLLDARPSPNVADYVENMIRDMSWGCGVSADLLWNIYKLGGANTRYVLADAQVFVQTEQQRLIDSWLAADYVWSTSLDMQLGLLPPCEDPEWWKHGWVPPARMTVDYGRDGKIMLDYHRFGLLTTPRFYALQGLDAREEYSAEMDYVEWRKNEMNRRQLTPDDMRMYEPRVGNEVITPGAESPGAEVPPKTKGAKPGDEGFDEDEEET